MWKQIIKELTEAGLTQSQIAQSIGITQATVSDLANGVINEPRWSNGDKLLRLHKNATSRNTQFKNSRSSQKNNQRIPTCLSEIHGDVSDQNG